MRPLRPNFIVGIGASAGGLNGFTALLDALPSNTGMAFVVLLHIAPAAESHLAEILSRHTKMRVMVVAQGMAIRANHVFVSSPDIDLYIENYTFKIVTPRTRRNVLIDGFLTSLAEAMGARAIGIILSGYGGDGTEGCKRIKAKGGTTFAQDMSADVPEMPLHAQAAGCIDVVLPPDKMSDYLQKIGKDFQNKKSG